MKLKCLKKIVLIGLMLNPLISYAGADNNKGAANLSGSEIINNEVANIYWKTARHLLATTLTEHGLVQYLVAGKANLKILNPLLNAYVVDAEYRADGRNNHDFGVDEAGEDAQIRVLREIQNGSIKTVPANKIQNMQNYLVNTKEFDPLNSYDPNKQY